MKDDFEAEEKKQAAADVLDQYSKFVMACIGNQVRPCDMRMHLRKEVSGLPTSLKRNSFQSLGMKLRWRARREPAIGVMGVK
ncbi:hypothetical protein MLD38_005517 [Melastoma candidum]|uniref:Uncharacterized protein n=1 Tax=Melastoma candidum TaxID=119954 RepID=A0ACB9RKG3_9MYRT|nr:hypothetical protein MLD38_005517 [Melastoma candidum]